MTSSVLDFSFFAPRPPKDTWFFAGLASFFPNITTSDSVPLSSRIQCGNSALLGCKVFHVPPNDSPSAAELDLDDAIAAKLDNQVLIFQFRGKFYAVDHSCPHSLHPLSKGTLFDIEDFGIRLSAGIRCSKHDWSFDLVRGNGDRGNYRLKIWEIQLRPVSNAQQLHKEEEKIKVATQNKEEESSIDANDQEVWVRRKQRIG